MPLLFKRPRFDPLAETMRQLTPGRIRQAAAGAVRDTVEILIDERFDERSDPDGNRWAPRKQPTGTWPILEKSGRMRKSYHVGATTTGVKVENSQPYAKVHQTGRANMLARPVLPNGNRMPEDWRDQIDEAVADELERIK